MVGLADNDPMIGGDSGTVFLRHYASTGVHKALAIYSGGGEDASIAYFTPINRMFDALDDSDHHFTL